MYRFANLDQLRRAGCRMGLKLALLRPVIGFVMVSHITEQQAGITPMDNQPNIAIDPYRPEALILRFVELMKTHSGAGGVKLEVKGRHLDGLLILVGELSEAIGEGVGDKEVHKRSILRRSVTLHQWSA